MNENDVKPVTGIKEQMKGSWMSLILMVVCLFTMFLVPVFRRSGEAFSQDLGIKIYAKLGWLPLIEVTGMQPIVYDTRISNQIIFWTIILITQFLAIAAGFLLVRRKMLSFIFSILFVIGNIILYFARSYNYIELGCVFERSKMGVGICACCFTILLLSYIPFQNKKVCMIMFYILCSAVTLSAAWAIVYTKIDKEKTVEILEDITPVYENKEEAAIEIAKKIGTSYHYDMEQYFFYKVVDDQRGRYAVVFKKRNECLGVYIENPNYLTGSCSDSRFWKYYDEYGADGRSTSIEVLINKIENCDDWQTANTDAVAELPDSYDEFSRDTEVKKGNVIERSSWEYDISRLNEEEMR